MRYISVNFRPTDMEVLYEPVRCLIRDSEEFQNLVSKIGIEVTEDEAHPINIRDVLAAWKELGFQIIIDDVISSRLKDIIGGNFHTVDKVVPLLDVVDHVKVDLEWAGLLLGSHPAYKTEVKEVILKMAKEDQFFASLKGQPPKDLGISYAEMLKDFVDFMHVACHNGVVIEQSVFTSDPNTAFALANLKELGLDIMNTLGVTFQGQQLGARAFEPAVIEGAIKGVELPFFSS